MTYIVLQRLGTGFLTILILFVFGISCKKKNAIPLACNYTSSKHVIDVFPQIYGLSYGRIDGTPVRAAFYNLDNDRAHEICVSSSKGNFCLKGDMDLAVAYNLTVLDDRVVAYLKLSREITIYDIADSTSLATFGYGWITDLEYSSIDSSIYFISFETPGYNDYIHRLFRYDIPTGKIIPVDERHNLMEFDFSNSNPYQLALLGTTVNRDSFVVMKFDLKTAEVSDSIAVPFNLHYPIDVEQGFGDIYISTSESEIYQVDFYNQSLVQIVGPCEKGRIGRLETNPYGQLVSLEYSISPKGFNYYASWNEVIVKW